jgi:hypothetical protein
MSGKIKFYTDEHVPLTVVSGLLRRGVDVLTTQKAKMLVTSDMERLVLAKRQGRVILLKTMISFVYMIKVSIQVALFMFASKCLLVT